MLYGLVNSWKREEGSEEEPKLTDWSATADRHLTQPCYMSSNPYICRSTYTRSIVYVVVVACRRPVAPKSAPLFPSPSSSFLEAPPLCLHCGLLTDFPSPVFYRPSSLFSAQVCPLELVIRSE